MRNVLKKVHVSLMLTVIFCTMVLQGSTVHAASFSPAAGDYITFGNIQQPIIWQIVSVKGKELTLMSYSSVEQMVFNDNKVRPCGDWNTSEVKKFLNTRFYENSFTSDEKKVMLPYNPKDTDIVYIPSLKELGLGNSKIISKLDKNYKAPSGIYQGEKFQKMSLSIYQAGSGLGPSFATRDSDFSLNRVINISQQANKNPVLSYSAGFMKMNIRPVIKITTDFPTENLQYVKATKKLNNQSVTLYTVDYKIKKVYIDGALTDLGQKTPKLNDKTVLVPLSIISDNFKIATDINTYTQAITLTKDTVTIKLTINSKQASVNGKLETLGTPVLQEGNELYVPAEFVAKALSGDVSYTDGNLYIKTH